MAKGRIPWARWNPISGRSRMSNKPRRVTVHIAVTDSPDIYGPGKGPGGTYAHCYNPVAGALLQHQELDRKTYADLDGNGSTISVEHQGRPGDRMSANQIDNMARLFAHAVTEYGVPNRIATWNNTSGLAWHRLGCRGNFGSFSKSDRTTWSGAQTGQRWSTAYGKTCPTDNFIHQIPEIYRRAQKYIGGGGSPAPSTDWFDTVDKNEMRDLLREEASGVAREVWMYPVSIASATKRYVGSDETNAVSLVRYAGASMPEGRNQHRETMATLAAQNAALKALADGQGADTEAIVKAVQDAVAEAVAGLDLEGSPDPQ